MSEPHALIEAQERAQFNLHIKGETGYIAFEYFNPKRNDFAFAQRTPHIKIDIQNPEHRTSSKYHTSGVFEFHEPKGDLKVTIDQLAEIFSEKVLKVIQKQKDSLPEELKKRLEL